MDYKKLSRIADSKIIKDSEEGLSDKILSFLSDIDSDKVPFKEDNFYGRPEKIFRSNIDGYEVEVIQIITGSKASAQLIIEKDGSRHTAGSSRMPLTKSFVDWWKQSEVDEYEKSVKDYFEEDVFPILDAVSNNDLLNLVNDLTSGIEWGDLDQKPKEDEDGVTFYISFNHHTQDEWKGLDEKLREFDKNTDDVFVDSDTVRDGVLVWIGFDEEE